MTAVKKMLKKEKVAVGKKFQEEKVAEAESKAEVAKKKFVQEN